MWLLDASGLLNSHHKSKSFTGYWYWKCFVSIQNTWHKWCMPLMTTDQLHFHLTSFSQYILTSDWLMRSTFLVIGKSMDLYFGFFSAGGAGVSVFLSAASISWLQKSAFTTVYTWDGTKSTFWCFKRNKLWQQSNSESNLCTDNE